MNVEESRSLVAGLIGQIAPDVDVESVNPDADLRREADLDSLDFQSLVELIAKQAHVDIPEVDYPQVRSLRGLSEYVAAHTA